MADLVIDIPDLDDFAPDTADTTADVTDVETLAIQEQGDTTTTTAVATASTTVVASDSASVRSHKSGAKASGEDGHDGEEKEPEVEEVGPPAEVYVWTVGQDPEQDDPKSQRLLLNPEDTPPVYLDSSNKKYSWFFIPERYPKPIHYDIVLGVSVENLKLENIHSILITIEQPTMMYDLKSTEVITGDQLKKLCQSTSNAAAAAAAVVETVAEEGNSDADVKDEKADYPSEKNVAEETVEEQEETKKAEETSEKVKETDEAKETAAVTEEIVDATATENVNTEETVKTPLEILKWKLMERYVVNSPGQLTVAFEIVTHRDKPDDFGSLGLHVAEIHQDASNFYKDESFFREHEPLYARVDFNKTGVEEHDSITPMARTVDKVNPSASGNHIVLWLIEGKTNILQVWQVQELTYGAPDGSESSEKEKEGATLVEPPPTPKLEEPFTPRLVAWMYFPDTSSIFLAPYVNWDGSQVYLCDATPLVRTHEDIDSAKEDIDSAKDLMAFYSVVPSGTGQLPTEASAGSGLVRNRVEDRFSVLKSFHGRGYFHIVATTDQDIKDELFIGCDGVKIHIFTTFGDWNYVKTININPLLTAPENHKPYNIVAALARQLRGKYFFLENPDGTQLSKWDLEKGVRVSVHTELQPGEWIALSNYSSVSRYGDLMAIPGKDYVKMFDTTTWTLLGSFRVETSTQFAVVSETQFICDDKYLLVEMSSSTGSFHEENRGYIVDVVTMEEIGQYIGFGSDRIWTPTYVDSPIFLYLGSSTLGLLHLENRIIRSPVQSRTRCDDRCGAPYECYYTQRSTVGVTPAGVRWRAAMGSSKTGSRMAHQIRFHFKVESSDGESGAWRTRMEVPVPILSRYDIYFTEDAEYLIIGFDYIYMVWRCPMTSEGEFELVYSQFYNTVDFLMCTCCRHGQIYEGIMVDERMDSLEWFSDCEDSFIAHQPGTFLNAAVFLTQDTYMYGSESMKRHIIRFLAKYVNAYPVMDDLSISLIAAICNEWKPHAHEAFLEVSKSLLSKTSHHWVPRHGMTQASNPVWILLDKARSHPKAIGLLEVFIDYCIRQAKRHKDPQYLVPIEQCLHELVDPSLFFSDAILRMLRQMAYLPARGHALLVDHHTIAHPPRFRWRFWRAARRGLRQHKDQVMQVSYEKDVDSEQESFSRSLYQVNFALLWRVIDPKAPPSSLPPTPPTVSPEMDASTAAVVTTKASSADEKTDPTLSGRGQRSQNLFSWTLAVLYMLRRKARLSRGNRVECHSFDLQALDNPALIALVEYKWNTIAFNYWLVRFLGQLLYYTLVLTAVFLQIYGDNRMVEKNVVIDNKPEVIKELFSNPGPVGLYISIVVIALMFLWLEIVQLMKDIRCYFESVYNWVDLFVFLLPLVGAISQILIIYDISNMGFNTGSLSFSVLLIFLHFLFELRVFQIVCHFVSIIIRAIYSIRVFIFVISGGLLAFAIAVLHLLHDCIDAEQCSYFTEKYSNNLLRSISVTYFMMGGNYDPVEGGFSSNSPAFHVMMMVFFFFTVILMMNVLIALINNAIGDGDQTWQLDWMLNRMRYIENAENMTYDIPGFRENHDYFPHTIFYSGSSQQVREYEKKTRQMEDEAAPVTLNADGQVQQLPESSDTATATATTAAAAVTAAAVVVAATATATAEKIDDDSASTKAKEKENGLTDEGVARLVETELRKQLDVERESSDRQISTLQQQLREQQQILVQILAKLEQ